MQKKCHYIKKKMRLPAAAGPAGLMEDQKKNIYSSMRTHMQSYTLASMSMCTSAY